MSVTEFYEATLGETFEYIHERSKYERERIENEWKVMRWQSTLILNIMAAKGKRYQPTELFTLDSETDKGPQITVDSPEALEAFKRMDEKYMKVWRSRLAT